MTSATLSGLTTLLLMLCFAGIVGWAYSARRKPDFDAASRIPLDDGDAQ